jgi:hypothetical protein
LGPAAFVAAGPFLEEDDVARAWHLMSRPQGMPTADNFALKDYQLP